MSIKRDFEVIAAELAFDLKEVDEIILSFVAHESPYIKNIARHLLKAGGKRIRPMLLILSAKTCASNFDKSRVYNLAAAVELIHTATLLHDDVIDNSDTRRGEKTANAVWGNKASILVGDFLFSSAFKLMAADGDVKVLDLLSETSAVMASGEVMQLETLNYEIKSVNQKRYFKIIYAKTAAIFAAACRTGGLIAGNDEEAVALEVFGKNLGLAFQIIDDVLDYAGDKKIFGKQIGKDFFEQKVTLPIILAYQNSDEKDRKKIGQLFSAKKTDAKDLKELLAILKKCDAVEQSINTAMDYKKLAQDSLAIFPNNQQLLTVLEYALRRNA